MADAERILHLAETIRYHRELYYNQSSPEITDADFDALWDELKELIQTMQCFTKWGQNRCLAR